MDTLQTIWNVHRLMREGLRLVIYCERKHDTGIAHASTSPSRDYCMGCNSPCDTLPAAGSRAIHFLTNIIAQNSTFYKGF